MNAQDQATDAPIALLVRRPLRTSSRVQCFAFAPFLLSVFFCVHCGPTANGGSIGAVLARDNDTHALHVRDAPAGRAAEKAGVIAGDEILMIDGQYVGNMDPSQIRTKLRGDVGTDVELTIVRSNEIHRIVVMRSPLGDEAPPEPAVETLDE